MPGIIYKDKEVFLAKMDRKLTHKEVFSIVMSFADMLHHLMSEIATVDKELATKCSKNYSRLFTTAYISMMACDTENVSHVTSALLNYIEEDRYLFILDPSNNWKVSIAENPKNLNSLINLILFCMIEISSELQGDINYVLRDVDISKRMVFN